MFLLIVGIIVGCVNYQSNSNDAHSHIVEIFPKLTVLESTGNSVLQQLYAVKGSDSPFTGTLERPQSGLSPQWTGEFENGKIQKLIRSTDSYRGETYFNETRESKNLIGQGWYKSGKRMYVHYPNHTGKRFYPDGSLELAYSDTANVYYWENGNPKIYWPVDSAAVKRRLEFDNNPLIFHPETSRLTYKVGNGQMKAWHKNGQLAIRGRLDDNKRTGRWIEYDSLGNVTRQLAYE